MSDRTLALGEREIRLDRPLIMGILNVTPDSFSDGGRWAARDAAVERALQMVEEGADIIDIGGESTRPGAGEVSGDEELERVVPVIEALRGRDDVAVSVDTSKAEVMRAAVAAGAGMINDVYALRRAGALEAAASSGAALCLMHMQGEPRTMQAEPRYDDVAAEVEAFLLERAAACEALGVPAARIVLDPGFGFGKTLDHNLELLRALPRLVAHGHPVLAGLSRKSMLGALTGRGVGDRLAASVTAAVLAVQAGAAIVRVHDVAQTRDALAVLGAVFPRRRHSA
jgi:dihydropteroate synthase